MLNLRKVKERIPKARFAINVSVLDGLGGNEIFYKFVRDQTNDKHKNLIYSQIKQTWEDLRNQESIGDGYQRMDSKDMVIHNEEKLQFLKKTFARLDRQHQRSMDVDKMNKDDVSLANFMMPRNDLMDKAVERDPELREKAEEERRKAMKQFKNVLLNF